MLTVRQIIKEKYTSKYIKIKKSAFSIVIHGASTGIYVTACNPHDSQTMSP